MKIKTQTRLIYLMWIVLVAGFLLLLGFGCFSAHAQQVTAVTTNGFTVVGLTTTQQNYTNYLPDTTAADWSKALGDIGIHVSAKGIGFALIFLLPFFKAICGYARKIIPKTAQVNQFGIWLAHGAGVDNPTLASLAAEIPPAPQVAATGMNAAGAPKPPGT